MVQDGEVAEPPPQGQRTAIMTKLGEIGHSRVQTMPPPVLPVKSAANAQGVWKSVSYGGSPSNNSTQATSVDDTAGSTTPTLHYDLNVQ